MKYQTIIDTTIQADDYHVFLEDWVQANSVLLKDGLSCNVKHSAGVWYLAVCEGRRIKWKIIPFIGRRKGRHAEGDVVLQFLLYHRSNRAQTTSFHNQHKTFYPDATGLNAAFDYIHAHEIFERNGRSNPPKCKKEARQS